MRGMTRVGLSALLAVLSPSIDSLYRGHHCEPTCAVNAWKGLGTYQSQHKPLTFLLFPNLFLRGGKHKERGDRSERSETSSKVSDGKISKSRSKSHEDSHSKTTDVSSHKGRKRSLSADSEGTHSHKTPRTERSSSMEHGHQNSSIASGGNAPIANFRISPATAKALAQQNITSLFPIQTATFDIIFDGRRAALVTCGDSQYS